MTPNTFTARIDGLLESTIVTMEFNDTQHKILAAAVSCVKQWGIEKTSLNDIAKQAGVTRPTVYSYFPNRNDVIRTALLQSGYTFAERLKAHFSPFTSSKERLLEAVLFALEELPKEPYLALLSESKADISGYINQDALNDSEGQAICLELFALIFADTSISDQDLIEVMEITVRLVLSLLMMPGPIQRKPEEMRLFLEKRLLSAVF